MIGAKAIYVGLRKQIFDALEPEAIAQMSKEQLAKQLDGAVELLIERERLTVPKVIRQEFVKNLVDELVGLGPLQALMDDESISDIMINGHENIFIERGGLVEKAHIDFIDERQLLDIAKRIAARVGRRVDESSPT
ncbi:CpaF family protein, partial [Vibrio sp. V29_P1S30P107]